MAEKKPEYTFEELVTLMRLEWRAKRYANVREIARNIMHLSNEALAKSK